MKSWKIAKGELSSLLKNRYIRLSFIVVSMVPLLYGVLYLWAFWDPYKNMKDVPIAVVNNDKGAVVDSANENFGDQIVGSLRENTNFKWEFVSQNDADNGLESKKYYVEVIIPEDFSQNLASVDSADPEAGVLQFKARKATNMLASQIANSAAVQISQAAGNRVSKKYFDNIFTQTRDISGELKKAADGSEDLATGLATAQSGSSQLADGTSSAYNGSSALANGINQILLGSDSLNSGMNQALIGAKSLDSGINLASDGAKSLVAGSAQVKGGISQVNAGVNQLITNVSATTSSLSTAKQLLSVPDVTATIVDSSSPFNGMTYAQAANYIVSNIVSQSTSSASQAQIAQLQGGLTQLSAGDNQLDQGVKDLSTALDSQVKAGSSQLVAGLSQLASGSSALNNGISSAKSGSEELSSGLSQLVSGASELNSGIGTASAGAETLSQRLSDGAAKIATSSGIEKSEKMTPVMSDPVRLADVSIGDVPNYGTGFAPYFIPLALWVGALILFLVIKTNETAYTGKANRVQIIMSKYLSVIIFGTIQAIVMDTVLIVGLKLSPMHPVLFYLFTILASWSFIAILQFFISILADAGKFIGIVLLMLQLTSAAGTFPIETTPRFFQLINPYLPMTYVVSGLREVISGGDLRSVMSSSILLAIVAVVFMILNFLFNRHIYRVDEETLENANELASAAEI